MEFKTKRFLFESAVASECAKDSPPLATATIASGLKSFLICLAKIFTSSLNSSYD